VVKKEQLHRGEVRQQRTHKRVSTCWRIFPSKWRTTFPFPPTAIKVLPYRQAMQLAEYFPLRSFLFMFAHICIFYDKPEQPAVVYAPSSGVSCQFVSYSIEQPLSTKHCKHVHAVVCVQQSGPGRYCSPIF